MAFLIIATPPNEHSIFSSHCGEEKMLVRMMRLAFFALAKKA
jgi:hypothetical protein